jgi:uncharacterized protein YutE (UPF0331/DUF86 family)
MKTIGSVRENILDLHYTENHLACFVVQATYIESLVRAYTEARTKTSLSYTKQERKIIDTFSKHITDNNVDTLVKILRSCGWIDENLQSYISSYFQFRNQVMHKLAKQVRDGKFLTELKNHYKKGEQLMNHPIFTNIDAIITANDQQRFVYGKGKIFNGDDISEDQIREVLELTLSGVINSKVSESTGLPAATIRRINLNQLATQIEMVVRISDLKKKDDNEKAKSIIEQLTKNLGVKVQEMLGNSRSANVVFFTTPSNVHFI